MTGTLISEVNLGEENRIFIVPRDMAEIFDCGGVSALPEGSVVTFAKDSKFLPALASNMNIVNVLSAGAVELGVPAIANAVERQSRKDTWGRIDRSARWIGAIAAEPNAVVAGKRIRDFHDKLPITFLDVDGIEKPATTPKQYRKGWLGIANLAITTAKDLGADEEYLDGLVQECAIAYQCQLVDGDMPLTYSDFLAEMDRLYDGLTVTDSLQRLRKDGIDCFEQFPEFLWKGFIKNFGNRLATDMTLEGLHPKALLNLGQERPSFADRMVVKLLKMGVKSWCKYAPPSWRYHPYLVESISPPSNFVTKAGVGVLKKVVDFNFGKKKA